MRWPAGWLGRTCPRVSHAGRVAGEDLPLGESCRLCVGGRVGGSNLPVLNLPLGESGGGGISGGVDQGTGGAAWWG